MHKNNVHFQASIIKAEATKCEFSVNIYEAQSAQPISHQL